tara:strand:- start:850 stop:1017 length:168 start_codon:yes stop_codon:yes gene_type:complete
MTATQKYLIRELTILIRLEANNENIDLKKMSQYLKMIDDVKSEKNIKKIKEVIND